MRLLGKWGDLMPFFRSMRYFLSFFFLSLLFGEQLSSSLTAGFSAVEVPDRSLRVSMSWI